jgi:FAD/FMN-containing dehydrogenase
VAVLEPYSRRLSTYALDEFFVPPRHFEPFVREMGRILRRHRVAAVNVSIRHSPADALALLPWAREEVFSFVLFYKQGVDLPAQRTVGEWTRELIDAALQHEGRYYLPYQLHATREQFERAYPEVAQLRQLKARVDPQGRFSNALWQKYL